MARATIKLVIDPDRNKLTFSKNFRIFSTDEPLSGIVAFSEYLESIDVTSPNTLDLNSYLFRSFRYSSNKEDWSLWYSVSPTNTSEISSIILDPASKFYFEIKYEYDNGNFEELDSAIQINEIKLRFEKADDSLPDSYAPRVVCSNERCTNFITTTNPSFKPYQVDSAIDMYRELSLYTNKIFGHDVVYFKTEPDSDSGDYIFKEWTLYKNIDRKCLKVVVPKNSFPSNAPKFTEFGMDFQLPFEVHIDHRYFQSIFGAGTEPRVRDFLYFPLLNRMFEIQGSYIHKGFMMTPTYWKVSLKKYNPNIDMLLTDDSRHFLDNVIQSAEQLFSAQVEQSTSDAKMTKQYENITTTFDSSRKAIHFDLMTKQLKYNFNHASLIQNYYDLTKIVPVQKTYQLTNDDPVVSISMNHVSLQDLDQNSPNSHYVILAYQESEIFSAWQNNALFTYDKNFYGTITRYLRVRGPFDTIPNHIGQSESGRYLRLEAYKDLSLKSQVNVAVDAIPGTEFKVSLRDSAVVYSSTPRFDESTVKNLTFTCLFCVPTQVAETLHFVNGYDSTELSGLKISANYVPTTTAAVDQPLGDITLNVDINEITKTVSGSNIKLGKWYALVVSLSNEFKQCGINVYEILEDPSDLTNHNELLQVINYTSSLVPQIFNLTTQYTLPSSNMYIANLRLFNTMIKQEQHSFILSQQFIKDESSLILIDNCRSQTNLPFIAKNR
jgi:hypothetical protein